MVFHFISPSIVTDRTIQAVVSARIYDSRARAGRGQYGVESKRKKNAFSVKKSRQVRMM